MPPLPVIDAKTFIKFLESLGFYFVRQKGSHVRYKHDDGRAVTVPIHGKEALENRVSHSIFTFYFQSSLSLDMRNRRYLQSKPQRADNL